MNVLCAGQNCRSDGRAVALPGLRLCAGCADRASADLAELPGLYDDCEHALVAGRPAVALRAGRGARAGGISLNEEAFTARSRIVECLASWAALVADERAVAWAGRRHPVELVAFLRTHLEWLLGHPAAADFAAEIARAAAHGRRSRHRQGGRRRDLSECVHPGCTATLTAAPATRDGVTVGEIRCAAGHAWQPHQWLQLSRQIQRARRHAKTAD